MSKISEELIIDTVANKPSGFSSTTDPFNPPQLAKNKAAEKKRGSKKESKLPEGKKSA